MPKILNNTSLYILLSDKFTHENVPQELMNGVKSKKILTSN